MILDFTLIGASGALGAIARYLSYLAGQVIAPTARFPFVTLAINVVGCLLLGMLMAFAEHRSSAAQRHLMLIGAIGFLGSFTTFSTFGFETFELMRAGHSSAALINILSNVLLGLGAVWLGRACWT